jgi:hypothetical protein
MARNRCRHGRALLCDGGNSAFSLCYLITRMGRIMTVSNGLYLVGDHILRERDDPRSRGVEETDSISWHIT